MAPKRNQNPNPMGGSLLNLERVPTLAPKFANQIGKTCTGFKILFTQTGFTVHAASTVDANGADIGTDASPEWVGIPEWERRRALRNAPSDEERLASLKRKYELRLNREFPGAGPANGSETTVQAWLATLPFAERRALLMSQKDFSKSYPDGFRA